jgi:hypothetical protein
MKIGGRSVLRRRGTRRCLRLDRRKMFTHSRRQVLRPTEVSEDSMQPLEWLGATLNGKAALCAGLLRS